MPDKCTGCEYCLSSWITELLYYVDDADERRFEVTVSVDSVGFPLQNAMFAGQTSLSPAAACYVRYKFYDRST